MWLFYTLLLLSLHDFTFFVCIGFVCMLCNCAIRVYIQMNCIYERAVYTLRYKCIVSVAVAVCGGDRAYTYLSSAPFLYFSFKPNAEHIRPLYMFCVYLSSGNTNSFSLYSLRIASIKMEKNL